MEQKQPTQKKLLITQKKYKDLKILLIEYLKNKGIHDEVDTTLIDEFVYAVFMIDVCKQSMTDYGLIMNVSKDKSNPYFQQSAAVSLYNSAIKNMTTISEKLTLTPAARAKLIDVDNQGSKDTFFEDNYSD